ncbi:uncharacterized protein LOC131957296 [Physella acuta]|uniref:uncharacterized protein LOC131957296 n=1 Tax=Physella acuta TaxID=109671 RepID=UPI0027DBA42E|nr:uncharacterized protein LOC131957296 [Physella acuta]
MERSARFVNTMCNANYNKSPKSSLKANKITRERSPSLDPGKFKDFDLKINEAEQHVSATKIVVSPYDVAMKRCAQAKLMPNKVYVPWYRNYKIPDIPDEIWDDNQPFDELQRRDEDIALQRYYGEKYLLFQDLRDPSIRQHRLEILRWYNRMKDRKKKSELTLSEDSRTTSVWPTPQAKEYGAPQGKDTRKSVFGPSAHEKSVLLPIIQFMFKIHQTRARNNMKQLKRSSNWRRLHKPEVAMKIAELVVSIRRNKAIKKFLRVIRLVLSVQRFIAVISKMSANTESLFKTKVNKPICVSKMPLMKGKKMFDAESKYKISNEIHVPMEVKLSLTTPWFQRSEYEIDKIVKCFQALKPFVEYPVNYQYYIGRVAWLMELPNFKVVIRQGQKAQSFYFVISGKLKVLSLKGNADCLHFGEFKEIMMYKAQDCFGEECISQPYSYRTYSIITDEPCILLSVNIHEVYQMEMNIKHNEEAPEHIRFLSTLPFLDNFPKPKLIEEADENVMLFYFRANTVITEDVEDSEFVYVVSWGSADVLVELLPQRKWIATYKLAERERLRRKSMEEMELDLDNIVKQKETRIQSNLQNTEATKKKRQSVQGSGNGLTTLTRSPRYQRVCQQEMRKTERRIAKQNELFQAESRRIQLKTYRLISSMSHKTSLLKEWSKIYSDDARRMTISSLDSKMPTPVSKLSSDLGSEGLMYKIDIDHMSQDSQSLTSDATTRITEEAGVEEESSLTQEVHHFPQGKKSKKKQLRRNQRNVAKLKPISQKSPRPKKTKQGKMKPPRKIEQKRKLHKDRNVLGSVEEVEKVESQNLDATPSQGFGDRQEDEPAASDSFLKDPVKVVKRKKIRPLKSKTTLTKTKKPLGQSAEQLNDSEESRDDETEEEEAKKHSSRRKAFLLQDENISSGGKKKGQRKKASELDMLEENKTDGDEEEGNRNSNKNKSLSTNNSNIRKLPPIGDYNENYDDLSKSKQMLSRGIQQKIDNPRFVYIGRNKPETVKNNKPFSQWELRKTLQRGDVVGTEWLDYNDHAYDPLDEKWSVVSRGALVIMIRKSLLLKYLRKEW